MPVRRFPYNQPVHTRILGYIAVLLSSAGIFISGFLSYTYIRGLAIPCRGAVDCDIIANHPSSSWFGIPVPIYGLAMYLTLLVLSAGRLALPAKRQLITKLGFGLSIFGLLISTVLTIYAITGINASCLWCVYSALVVLGLTICFAFMLFLESDVASKDADAEGGTAVAGSKAADPLAFVLPAIGVVVALGLIPSMVGNLQKRIDTAASMVVLGGRTAVDLLPQEAKVKGPRDAPVTIIEFADPNCPSCRASHPRMQALMDKYPGKIRLGFRHTFRTDGGGGSSPIAAVIAEYAATQGRFWDFHDAVFDNANQGRLRTNDGVIALATNIGFSRTEINENLQDPELAKRVADDIALGVEIGVVSTPTYIVFGRGAPAQVYSSIVNLEQAFEQTPLRELVAE